MMASPDNPDDFEKPGPFSGGIRLNLAWRMAVKQYTLIAVGHEGLRRRDWTVAHIRNKGSMVA